MMILGMILGMRVGSGGGVAGEGFEVGGGDDGDDGGGGGGGGGGRAPESFLKVFLIFDNLNMLDLERSLGNKLPFSSTFVAVAVVMLVSGSSSTCVGLASGISEGVEGWLRESELSVS